MATWTQGQPYTSGTEDDVTAMVNADRTADAVLDGGVELDSLTSRVIARDDGATVASTNVLTTMLAGTTCAIPANPLANDIYIFRAYGPGFNASGSGRTLTLTEVLGASAVLTGAAEAIANGTLAKIWWVETHFTIETAGASGVVQCFTRHGWSGDNVETTASGYPRQTVTTLTGVDLTAAKTIGMRVTPSASSASLTCGALDATVTRWRAA